MNRPAFNLSKLSKLEGLYLIQSKPTVDSETFLKIGHTGNIDERTNTHGSEIPVEVPLHTIFGKDLYDVEQNFIKKFSNLRIATKKRFIEFQNSGTYYFQKSSREIFKYDKKIIEYFETIEKINQISLETSVKKFYGRLMGVLLINDLSENFSPIISYFKQFDYESYALVNFDVDLRNRNYKDHVLLNGNPDSFSASSTYGFVNLISNIETGLMNISCECTESLQAVFDYAKLRRETDIPWYDFSTAYQFKKEVQQDLIGGIYNGVSDTLNQEIENIRCNHDPFYYKVVNDLKFQFEEFFKNIKRQ